MGVMPTYVEVWPVAADQAGIWLCSGTDAWRPRLPVEADSSPHGEVQMLLATHGIAENPDLIHSTSWRPDGPSLILTYIVVVPVTGDVRAAFPAARPVGLGLTQVVGKPLPHAPAEEPTPRYIDVLLHGLRHLVYLLTTDESNAAAMGEYWRRHLAGLEPVLAGLYKLDEAA